MKVYTIKADNKSLFAIVYENGKEICTCTGEKAHIKAERIKEALIQYQNRIKNK